MVLYSHPIDIQFGWQPTFSAELRLVEEGESIFWDEQIDLRQTIELERQLARVA